jgi:RNA-directed DNA polymerase
MSATKPFNSSKQQLMEAFKAVKANAGAVGVDGQSIEDFERDLKGSLYKVWDRMSSGSYFPPPGESGGHSEEDGWGTHLRRAHRCRQSGLEGSQDDV